MRLNPPNRRIRTRTYGGVGGAEPRGFPLSRFVLRQGARLVAIGTMLGLAGSAAMAHVLASALAGDVGSPDFLFGLRELDPIAFGTVSPLISVIALLACYIPALRATRVDPMVALRYE